MHNYYKFWISEYFLVSFVKENLIVYKWEICNIQNYVNYRYVNNYVKIIINDARTN